MARGSRRTTLVISLSVLMAALGAAHPVAAQEERTVQAAELEAICRENAPNRGRRRVCLDIVKKILAPDGSIVLPAIVAPIEPIEGPTVGAELTTDHLSMLLAEVDWEAEAGFSADEGSRWVAALFEVSSMDPDAYVAVPNFTATDADGFSYRFGSAVKPNLENGALPDGQKRRGWVTFEVPEDAARLTIEYFPFVSDSDEPLSWTVAEG